MTDRKPTCVACKGAGGANYTAGTGIVIESNEISADTTVLQPKLTAGSGIAITNDVISVDGAGSFTRYTETDWSIFVSNGVVTEDLLIRFNENIRGFMFIPKGTPAIFGANVTFGTEARPTLSSNYLGFAGNQINSILNNSSNVKLNIEKIEFNRTEAGGMYTMYITIEETYTISKTSGIFLYRRS